MKKYIPFLAVQFGVAGYFLRRWELETAFDDKALHIAGSSASMAFLAFTLLTAALAAAVIYRQPKQDKTDFISLFACKGNQAVYVASLGFYAMLLFSGVLELLGAPYFEVVHDRMEMTRLVFAVLLGIFSILTGGMMMTVAGRLYRGEGKTRYLGRLLLPAFMSCFWLLSDYRSYAGNPTTYEYIYRLFAVMAILLAFYYQAACSFEKPKVRRFSFFAVMAVYFSVTSMADPLPASTRMRMIACGALMAVNLYAMQANANQGEIPAKPEFSDNVEEKNDEK